LPDLFEDQQLLFGSQKTELQEKQSHQTDKGKAMKKTNSGPVCASCWVPKFLLLRSGAGVRDQERLTKVTNKT